MDEIPPQQEQPPLSQPTPITPVEPTPITPVEPPAFHPDESLIDSSKRHEPPWVETRRMEDVG
jgi:hypothetical protein